MKLLDFFNTRMPRWFGAPEEFRNPYEYLKEQGNAEQVSAPQNEHEVNASYFIDRNVSEVAYKLTNLVKSKELLLFHDELNWTSDQLASDLQKAASAPSALKLRRRRTVWDFGLHGSRKGTISRRFHKTLGRFSRRHQNKANSIEAADPQTDNIPSQIAPDLAIQDNSLDKISQSAAHISKRQDRTASEVPTIPRALQNPSLKKQPHDIHLYMHPASPDDILSKHRRSNEENIPPYGNFAANNISDKKSRRPLKAEPKDPLVYTVLLETDRDHKRAFSLKKGFLNPSDPAKNIYSNVQSQSDSFFLGNQIILPRANCTDEDTARFRELYHTKFNSRHNSAVATYSGIKRKYSDSLESHNQDGPEESSVEAKNSNRTYLIPKKTEQQ